MATTHPGYDSATRWVVLGIAVALAGLAPIGSLKRSPSSAGRALSDSAIGDGERTALGTAQNALPYEVLFPPEELVPSSSLDEVWSQPAFDEIALVYGPSERSLIVDEYVPQSPDPVASFKAETEQHVADSQIASIHGVTALVTEPRTDATKSNPADVRFFLNGVEVNIWSPDYGTGELTQIAEQMIASTPWPSASVGAV
jgi:hypothetical protein